MICIKIILILSDRRNLPNSIDSVKTQIIFIIYKEINCIKFICSSLFDNCILYIGKYPIQTKIWLLDSATDSSFCMYLPMLLY